MISNNKLFSESQILDNMHEGLYAVDKNFTLTGFNRAAEHITGYSRADVVGKYCKDVLRTNRCREGCPMAVALEMNENLENYDMLIRDRDSKSMAVKVNTVIFKTESGQAEGGAVLFRPVGEPGVVSEGQVKRAEFQGIIGQNKKMQELYDLIEEISDSDAAVMIQGESGTGKELVANAIQSTGTRRDKPYIKVNCSVLPPSLLASELFGHVKGAFTDAHRDRVGRFEMAHLGTIFLDEIAETEARIQLQLLRVIQEGTFERVGESVTRKVDVRIIAATNLNLDKAIAQGKFREDLYYRLHVIPIYLPPLRERKDDIPFLVQHFLKKYMLITGKKIGDLDDETMSVLYDYHWPGNIRELENVIEYAFARTKTNLITVNKLPPHLLQIRETPRASTMIDTGDDKFMNLKAVLDEVRWNRNKAAEKLGISRATLWRKMKSLKLLE
jgi:PAS domain S-box-containing protein